MSSTSFTPRKGKRRPNGPSQDDLGLSGNPGKGDVPRNCFSPQFRDNYDRIDWKREPRILSGFNKFTFRYPRTIPNNE